MIEALLIPAHKAATNHLAEALSVFIGPEADVNSFGPLPRDSKASYWVLNAT